MTPGAPCGPQRPSGAPGTPTFPAFGTQVLPDVVMHTHVLFQHVLPGKGLSTLLTGVAFHTCKQTQQCLKAPPATEEVSARGTRGLPFSHVPWSHWHEKALRTGVDTGRSEGCAASGRGSQDESYRRCAVCTWSQGEWWSSPGAGAGELAPNITAAACYLCG